MSVSKTSKGKNRLNWRRCLTVVVAVPILYFGIYFLFRGQVPTDPQVIAHRGGPVDAPESTMLAFQNAAIMGVDSLEFDVQRSKDGVLVVFHDETVDRTTDGTGNVRDLTLQELQGLDAGEGEQIPTFDKVIAFGKEAGVDLLPEAKLPDKYPGLEIEMLDALEEAGYSEHAVIQSFNWDTLDAVIAANPEIDICPLYGLWKFNLSNPQSESAGALCPMAEMVLLNPWMIRQAHLEGREVFVWFGMIENPFMMRMMLIFGADGLMVDDPGALIKILEK